jgi:hypothetical protein
LGKKILSPFGTVSFPRFALLCSWLAALVLALPVVYLLVMGPLWRLAMRQPEQYAGPTYVPYLPLVRIAEEHPAVDGWISSYVELWYPKDVSRRGSITMKQIGKGPPAPRATP